MIGQDDEEGSIAAGPTHQAMEGGEDAGQEQHDVSGDE